MQTTATNVPRSETVLKRPEPVFALFRLTHDGREEFTGLCTRRDLASHAGWPTIRAYPIQPDQLVLL